MQALLRLALTHAAKVSNDADKPNFVKDFLDFNQPGLSYKKMKENKQGKYITDAAKWNGGWHTNEYFRKSKSDFAFYLNDELCKLNGEELKQSITLPKHIDQAIRFVLGMPIPEDNPDDDGAENNGTGR
jgi:hypothetical protein